MSKYATLTAGLLARKGEAEPAATPFAEQLLTRVAAPAPDIGALTPAPHNVHIHAESGAKPKPQGFGAPDASTFTSVFGTVAKRKAETVVRQKEPPAKPPVAPALSIVAAPDDVRKEVRRVLDAFGAAPGHIFNLGHGISPQARVEAVAALVDEVRTYSKKMRASAA